MSERFFPSVGDDSRALERRFRTAVAGLDEVLVARLYEVLTEAHAPFTTTTFEFEEEAVLATQGSREIRFPRPLPMVKYAILCYGYVEWLRRKYALPGFAEVAPGDVVVDCGAYVGGFTLSAARVASAVHAFEPAAENHASLLRNVSSFSNVHAKCAALFDETGELDLNMSSSSVEHSFLEPDHGSIVEVRRVRVFRLEDYCEAAGLARLDFVKIEAEGAELEVFEGLGALRPAKLAIDVSPERDRRSPAEPLRHRLDGLGYEVRQRRKMLFARRNG